MIAVPRRRVPLIAAASLGVALVIGTSGPASASNPVSPLVSASPSVSSRPTIAATPSPSVSMSGKPTPQASSGAGGSAATVTVEDLLPGAENATSSLTTLNGSAVSTDIVVPRGLVPSRLTAQIEPPVSLTGTDLLPGTVDVFAGTRLVGRVPAVAGPFTGKLLPTDVDKDGILRIQLRYSTVDNPVDADLCRDTRQSVTMRDIAVAYSGKPARPTSIAQFLAPGVRAVSVVIQGTTPSNRNALTQAGLAAVSALSYRFGPTVPVVMTFDQPDPRVTAVLGSRIVVFAPGSSPTTTTITMAGDVPTLTIAGTGSGLSEAASALGSDKIPLAGAADTTGLSQTGKLPQTSRATLADLGSPRPSLSGWGSSTIYVGVKQSQFQGPVSGVKVHLSGTHTSVPKEVASSVNVYWNGYLIASQTLSTEVPFELTADVPDSVLTPNNGLQVTLTSVASSGDCASSIQQLPMELFLDGAQSVITAGRGQTLAPGFARFPQALADSLPIAFAPGSSFQDAAIQAAYIVGSLQNANAKQLNVSLVSLDVFKQQSVAGLVTGADEVTSNALEAPLRLTEFRAVNSSTLNFGVGVTLPYAALQSFEQNGRNLLMLGSWSPSGDQNALAQATALDLSVYAYGVLGGWSALSGNILLGQPNAEPVALTTNAIALQPTVSNEYRPIAWWVLGAFLVLMTIGLLRMYSARRSRRKLKAYVDAQEQSDADGASRSAAYQARLEAMAEASVDAAEPDADQAPERRPDDA